MFRVELNDRSFNRISFLDEEYEHLNWSYLRIGGCGGGGFTLPRKFCQELNIATDFNVNIYKKDVVNQQYDLWYQGLITNKSINVRSKNEQVDISMQGYAEQLNRIYVDQDYTSQEVSVTVKAILDNFITPNTDITYSAGDLEASSFTANNLEFNTTAKSAIQTLADLVDFEWGVDKDRKFYFKAKSTSVGHRFSLGGRLTGFFSDDSSRDIVNRVIVKGGDVSGSPFTPDPTQAAYNDTNSQLKWGRRDFPVHNTAIVTDAVAEQYAATLMAERSEIVRRANAELHDPDDRIEATTPIPQFELVSRGITYGEKKYGTFLYSGRVPYTIKRVQYNVEISSLRVSLELGQPRPEVGDTIAQLDHRLDQLRSQGV